MKQMRTRYMQLGRTEIGAHRCPNGNDNKFACQTRARSVAPFRSLKRLFIDMEIKK